MRQELKEKMLATAPMLYKYFKDNPKSVIDCPDDLFEFIFELSVKIEDFNKRFPRRRVRFMKVAMEYGEFVVVTNRQVFTVQKLIAAATSQIRSYRRSLLKGVIGQTLTIAAGPALQVHPQFAEKCDWSKLDGSDWCWLLQKQPQFADKRKKIKTAGNS